MNGLSAVLTVLGFPSHTVEKPVRYCLVFNLFLPNLFGGLSVVVAVIELYFETLCGSLSPVMAVLGLSSQTPVWDSLSALMAVLEILLCICCGIVCRLWWLFLSLFFKLCGMAHQL